MPEGKCIGWDDCLFSRRVLTWYLKADATNVIVNTLLEGTPSSAGMIANELSDGIGSRIFLMLLKEAALLKSTGYFRSEVNGSNECVCGRKVVRYS